MNKDNYLSMLRILSVVIAGGMWVLSIKFSVDGFDMAGMQWAGLMLGLFVTGIELIWNKAGVSGGFKNLTLFAVGILSYVYGVYTNVAGIMLAQGGDKVAFAIILGLALEITPEVLLVWGLIGSSDGGDLLSNLFGFSQPITTEKRQAGLPNVGQQRPMQMPQQQGRGKTPQQQGRGQPMHGRPQYIPPKNNSNGGQHQPPFSDDLGM